MASHEELMRLLNFDADDLRANRAGQLSPRQQQRLLSSRRRITMIYAAVMLAVALCAAAALYAAQRNDAAIAVFIGIALTIVNALVMARAVQQYMRLSDDARRASIHTISGSVERTVRVVGRAVIYVLKIGGHELVVPKSLFNVVADGAAWRFYRAPRSGTLLSAEPRE
jgi:hypothetical protein